MSVIMDILDMLGILSPLKMGFSAIVIIGLLIYILKRA